MKPTSAAVSPLRQRMVEDMRMRKLEVKTRTAYIRAVTKLAAFLGRSPDTATEEDLRRFQLYMVDQGTSPITINATITGLKFFFDITLRHPELMARMQPVRVPQKLPVVLSRDETARLIAAAPNLKSQTALSIAYGTGLRVSEVIALKVTDVDSKRTVLRVEQGKGRKDRYAMLSPVLLERLRAWWRQAHSQGKMLPNGWLFPGLDPKDPLTARQLTAFCTEAVEEAIAKYGKPEIFNTVQGSQFTSSAFTGLLPGHGIRISMDGKGCWRDNVFIERVWRSIKYEKVYLHANETVSAAREGIGRYINFYNTRRPHSSHQARTPDVVYFASLPQPSAEAA